MDEKDKIIKYLRDQAKTEFWLGAIYMGMVIFIVFAFLVITA